MLILAILIFEAIMQENKNISALANNNEEDEHFGKSSLEKALAIFDLYHDGKFSYSPEEIAELVGIAQSSCYRYLKVLGDHGLIVQSSTGYYTIGPRVSLLEFEMRKNDPLIHVAETYAQKLVSKYSAAALVSRAFRDELVCIYRCQSKKDPRDMFKRGNALSRVRGAHARVLQTYLSRYRLNKLYLEHLDEFKETSYGDSFSSLCRSLIDIRRDQICFDLGGFRDDSVGICAPLLVGEEQTFIGTIGLTFDKGAINEKKFHAIKKEVHEAARKIEKKLSS